MILVTRCVTGYVSSVVGDLASPGERVVIMAANKTDLARTRRVTEKQVTLYPACSMSCHMSYIINRDVTLH